MPRDLDHIIDMFNLATERQKAGLPVWDQKVNLRGVFHDDTLTFEERRDRIVTTLRNSPWLRGRDEFDPLTETVDNLADAQDPDEFDEWWEIVYDHADVDRVWIATF